MSWSLAKSVGFNTFSVELIFVNKKFCELTQWASLYFHRTATLMLPTTNNDPMHLKIDYDFDQKLWNTVLLSCR